MDFGELKKINLVIGQNNSGKSNVISSVEFARSILPSRGNILNILTPTDYHNRVPTIDPRIEIGFDIPNSTDFGLISGIFDQISYEIVLKDGAATILSTSADARYGDISSDKAFEYYKRRTGVLSGSYQSDAVIRDFNSFLRDNLLPALAKTLLPVKIIPEFRKISEGDTYSLDGRNLIKTLANFKAPPIGRDSDRLKFEKILRFFIELTDMPEATDLSIITDHSQIIVDDGQLRLPLSSYGTGIHQLVIMLTAVLSDDGGNFAIEEPEIHLHPRLQHRLFDFFLKETDSNFLISSHSSSLINSAYKGIISGSSCSIIRVSKRNKVTTGESISEDRAVLDSINDLGIDANDILQSVYIIWTEGPSDRIYINRWIEIVDPEIKEGINYRYLYYGGRLLNNYKVGDNPQAADDLIDIITVNRNCSIVIDSDLRNNSDTILDYKSRIAEEAKKLGVICWITQGREIENYVANRAVVNGMSKKSAALPYNLSRFDKIDLALRASAKKAYGSDRGYKYEYAKVKYSIRIAQHIKDLSDFRLDLHSKISDIVNDIRKANNMPINQRVLN